MAQIQHDSIRTIDAEEIRAWAEARDGKPAVVESTKDEDGGGMLRIDFGEKEPGLEEISWDDFFRIFDDNNLAFLYQERTSDGGVSYFFKFVERDAEDTDDGDADMTNEDDEEDESEDDESDGDDEEAGEEEPRTGTE